MSTPIRVEKTNYGATIFYADANFVAAVLRDESHDRSCTRPYKVTLYRLNEKLERRMVHYACDWHYRSASYSFKTYEQAFQRVEDYLNLKFYPGQPKEGK